jgi:putative transposase
MKENRREFARKALLAGANLSALCREYDVTRKTGRQWRERAREEGVEQMQERSRRPHRSPRQLEEKQLCHLVRLRLAYPTWGPKKLCTLYRKTQGTALSVSTCHRVLKAAGLVAPRKRRVRPPVLICAAARPTAPNEVWTLDFKGWWRLGSGERCEPLTVRDAYSRYVLSAHLPPNGRAESVRVELERLFRQHGLPRVIKSDNGAPFAARGAPQGLSQLAAEWVALGIVLERSRPGHPQDNGAHERLHRDLQAEVQAHVQVDRRAQQAALDLWRRDYNEVRPHEALQGRCPAELYRPSPRRFPGAAPQPEYGPGYLPRKVQGTGKISYEARVIFLTTALAGRTVGLRLISTTTLEVWFHYLRLGIVDLQTNRFASAPSRSSKAVGLAA